MRTLAVLSLALAAAAAALAGGPGPRYAVIAAGAVVETLDADGKLARVVDSSGYAHEPRWSPGGSMLAWVGPQGVLVERADGRDKRVLVPTPGPCSDACEPLNFAWSPDGRFIAAGGGGTRTTRVLVVSVATGRRHYVEPARPFTLYTVLGWTRDGSVVSVGGRDIHVTSADGRITRVAYRLGYERCSACTGLSLSPDGRAVASVRYTRDYRPALLVAYLRTGKVRVAGGVGATSSAAPAWSPDSRNVALVALGGPAFTLRAGGGPPRSLGLRADAATWAPDGEILLNRGGGIWIERLGGKPATPSAFPGSPRSLRVPRTCGPRAR